MVGLSSQTNLGRVDVTFLIMSKAAVSSVGTAVLIFLKLSENLSRFQKHSFLMIGPVLLLYASFTKLQLLLYHGRCCPLGCRFVLTMIQRKWT